MGLLGVSRGGVCYGCEGSRVGDRSAPLHCVEEIMLWEGMFVGDTLCGHTVGMGHESILWGVYCESVT